MVTRIVAINNLRRFIGTDLSEIAPDYGISPFSNGKQNKGWKGLTLERLAGLSNSNKQAPNGLGFELKSTSFRLVNDVWKPKETCAITMINPMSLTGTSFFESHCWEKMKSLIFCAVSWNGSQNCSSVLLEVQSFDFLEDSTLLAEIKEDYDTIRNKCITSGFNSLTGKDGKWIQARTKGSGHGSTSRAFYARKQLIEEIINLHI
ncbi:MutH/Sau3AI family endonuclease [Flectobacillus roseus]|uniref:MutH/Sau3AI family endonuclease n=1 Tax=Flectobacillus roseus TaxID=502259 RepID=A0ABT6Y369_9BACT|nr:MutH/Sau3AI family endonuclease [Flectobacillus roseus]MDI9857971.1 MutH/Sau3AI family endonuclease [Flectobacillus roseus]